jgi:hypothetical protein
VGVRPSGIHYRPHSIPAMWQWYLGRSGFYSFV